ncbi:MAG: response regulator transcription factor [Clostridia bacterium]|nr:response regulator transcription factor [Clostridia bacterium]MBR0121529.1 response regulator transcription factor [Clostridia bacterium]
MFNILICDDEADIRTSLKIYLTSEGYTVSEASNGEQALAAVKNGEKIDLILMDIMMPVMNGIEAMVKIREISTVPIILLSAKSEDSDIIVGLNVGADDYITKPFNSIEVMARVKALIRRSLVPAPVSRADVLVNGGIEIDNRTKTVTVDGNTVSLTPKEFDILHFFMEHPGEVFSPQDIYVNVWENDPYGAENTVTVHIRHLREKIEINPAEPRYIKVSWGHGYKMEKLD